MVKSTYWLQVNKRYTKTNAVHSLNTHTHINKKVQTIYNKACLTHPSVTHDRHVFILSPIFTLPTWASSKVLSLILTPPSTTTKTETHWKCTINLLINTIFWNIDKYEATYHKGVTYSPIVEKMLKVCRAWFSLNMLWQTHKSE